MSLSVTQDERNRATATQQLQEDALFGGIVGEETISPVGTKADADAADQLAGTRARGRQVAYAQQRALQVQPAWVGVTAFLHSWVNFGSPELPARYRKDLLGAVEVSGAVANGTAGSIFILPEGFRPEATLRFITYADSGAAIVVVDVSGAVSLGTYIGAGSNVLVQLDGVRFWPPAA